LIADVAVIGLPDPASGERCCAVVTCPGEALGFDEMSEFLTGRRLSRHKIPEQLEIVDAIPRNAAGKVEKRVLRERYAQS
jgi:non-ribosomal peptide synthetase component E (peptide arylation enzyme)